MSDVFTVALFGHTGQGNEALTELLANGVAREAIQVIGDVGAPAGEAGAMHHVTFDVLHIPKEQRGQFMDGIRAGGVVLAVVGGRVEVEEMLRKHGALVVERTDGSIGAVSHNVA